RQERNDDALRAARVARHGAGGHRRAHCCAAGRSPRRHGQLPQGTGTAAARDLAPVADLPAARAGARPRDERDRRAAAARHRGGGVLKLAALMGCGDACSHAARGIGALARGGARLLLAIVDPGGKAATLDAKLAVTGELIVFARVLAPALIAAAVAWIAIRRSLARAGMQELVSATHARPARRDDGKERQLI